MTIMVSPQETYEAPSSGESVIVSISVVTVAISSNLPMIVAPPVISVRLSIGYSRYQECEGYCQNNGSQKMELFRKYCHFILSHCSQNMVQISTCTPPPNSKGDKAA
jgi:hypothetical protein